MSPNYSISIFPFNAQNIGTVSCHRFCHFCLFIYAARQLILIELIRKDCWFSCKFVLVSVSAGVMASSDRDVDFCSGGDEDDMSGLHSPSASEDSVEVQVAPISLRNKRKLAEPRKIQEPSTAPLKKRRLKGVEEMMPADEEESRATRSIAESVQTVGQLREKRHEDVAANDFFLAVERAIGISQLMCYFETNYRATRES